MSHREGDQRRTWQRGLNARLEKANGYFYFKGGEADRINRTTERYVRAMKVAAARLRLAHEAGGRE